MSLFVVLSGPQSQRSEALKALADAGFPPVVDGHGDPVSSSWGHPADASRAQQSFITVRADGDDVDRAGEVADGMRWRLRAHFDEPEPVRELTARERLAAVGLTPDDLRELLA